jgi:4-hydroxy-4-methyl-2-oxoglutarate aldolase
MPTSLSTIASLRRFSACTIANAIETLELRLRNEGFTNSGLRAFSSAGSFVGHAVTVRIRCSSPPPDGQNYIESTQWWNYVLSIPAPRIVVIQDVDPAPGSGALIGEVHATILRALGCGGVVTNGSIRDLPALQRMEFHAYAGGLAVSHAYSHIVDMGEPVEIAGLKITSGDLLHGDVHGLVSIPKDSEKQVAEAAEKLLLREREILELCRPENFSLDSLRDAIRASRAIAT